MFPVFILDGKTELPKKGTFYVIARDGIYLSKDTGLIRAVVKMSGISFLKTMEVKAELFMPKIPSILAAQALLFFRRIYGKHYSEAIVLIYYSAQKKSYLLDAPVQQVTGTSVDYEPQGKFADGYQLVGDFHSHPSFSAFHSGTDVDDEKAFDGIHITMGRVDTPYCTISSTVAVNNNRFPIDPENCILGLTKVDYQPPSSFLGYKRPYGVPRKKAGSFDFTSQLYDWWNDLYLGSRNHLEPTQFYDLVLPYGMDYRNCAFPQRWLDRVSKKNYSTSLVESVAIFPEERTGTSLTSEPVAAKS